MDSAAYAGYTIPPYYDSLVGKLIVHGKSRNECLMRLRRALDELVVGGIDTTIPLFQELIKQPDILDGDYNIHWLENHLAHRSAGRTGTLARWGKSCSRALERWSPQLLSLTRIAFGITFVEHGTQKLFSFPLEPVGGLGPGMLLFVGLLETIGGALVTLGLFTRSPRFCSRARWRSAIGPCMRRAAFFRS